MPVKYTLSAMILVAIANTALLASGRYEFWAGVIVGVVTLLLAFAAGILQERYQPFHQQRPTPVALRTPEEWKELERELRRHGKLR